jgi:ketosteroid isomerase-like protein
MKKIVVTMMVMSLAGTTVMAQPKAEKEVAATVEAFKKAMVDADKATLEKLTDNSLTYGHSSGVIQDKPTFVENIVNGNSDFVTIDLTDQTIHVSGNTAIVRHILNAQTNDKGKGPGTVKLSILTVWQKKHGKWVLLARQAVKV